MDVGTYIRRVQSGFGDYNEIVITKEEIIDWLNEAQEFVVRETQCFLDTHSAAANTFPLTIADMFLLKNAAYGTSLLSLTNYEAIADWYKNPVSGVPQYFYLDGMNVNLWPTPTASDTTSVTIRYVRAPVGITTGTPEATTLEVPLPYHSDLVIFSLARAHEKNENYRAMELKMQEFAGNVAHRRYEIQHGSDGPYIMTMSPEDYVDDENYGSLL